MLVRIASPDNARVRLVRKLHTRKGRNTSKKFAAEGINLISEIITLGLRPDFIMVSDKWMDDDTCSDERRELILGCMQSDSITVCEVPASLFEQITDAGNGVGVLAVLDMIKQDASVLDDLGPDDNILVLDRIQDPGNMGTMIRTAVAAGYKAIIASHGTVDIYSSKVLRSTAGMIFQIPVLYASDEDDLDQMLKRSGKKTAVTVPQGGKFYYEENIGKGVALIIGNEGNGASDRLIKEADIRITLPMMGNVESLNAAAAASILMYEAVRCRRGAQQIS